MNNEYSNIINDLILPARDRLQDVIVKSGGNTEYLGELQHMYNLERINDMTLALSQPNNINHNRLPMSMDDMDYHTVLKHNIDDNLRTKNYLRVFMRRILNDNGCSLLGINFDIAIDILKGIDDIDITSKFNYLSTDNIKSLFETHTKDALNCVVNNYDNQVKLFLKLTELHELSKNSRMNDIDQQMLLVDTYYEGLRILNKDTDKVFLDSTDHRRTYLYQLLKTTPGITPEMIKRLNMNNKNLAEKLLHYNDTLGEPDKNNIKTELLGYYKSIVNNTQYEEGDSSLIKNNSIDDQHTHLVDDSDNESIITNNPYDMSRLYNPNVSSTDTNLISDTDNHNEDNNKFNKDIKYSIESKDNTDKTIFTDSTTGNVQLVNAIELVTVDLETGSIQQTYVNFCFSNEEDKKDYQKKLEMLQIKCNEIKSASEEQKKTLIESFKKENSSLVEEFNKRSNDLLNFNRDSVKGFSIVRKDKTGRNLPYTTDKIESIEIQLNDSAFSTMRVQLPDGNYLDIPVRGCEIDKTRSPVILTSQEADQSKEFKKEDTRLKNDSDAYSKLEKFLSKSDIKLNGISIKDNILDSISIEPEQTRLKNNNKKEIVIHMPNMQNSNEIINNSPMNPSHIPSVKKGVSMTRGGI